MKKLLSLFAATLISASAIAQPLAPDVLVKNLTADVIESLRKDADIRSGNAGKAAALIEAKALPAFDFPHMTALALGKDWRQASPEQQAALTAEFRTLLVLTYSNALTAFRDQTVDFKPFKVEEDASDAVVRSEIRQPGAQSTRIDYTLSRGDSDWKIYDVTVAGISLVTSYRDQFSQQVRSDGIDGLIRTLHAKNAAQARR